MTNDLGVRDLFGGVEPVPVRRIHPAGLEQPLPVVEPERLGAQPGGSREVTDRHGGHRVILPCRRTGRGTAAELIALMPYRTSARGRCAIRTSAARISARGIRPRVPRCVLYPPGVSRSRRRLMNDPGHSRHGDHATDVHHGPDPADRQAEHRDDHHGGHGDPGGHGHHGGHGDHVGQFRRLFWIMLVLAVPVVGFSGMFSMLLGYSLPDRRLGRLDLAAARHRHVRVGRPAVPDRRRRRAPSPAARDDAAHRPGHHGGVPRLLGRRAWASCTTSSTSGGSWRC